MQYFAYGSNMSRDVMHAVCPGHQLVGVARLPDHRLAFTRRSIRTGTGVADIVRERDHSVWGVLYEVSSDDLKHLDRKEGCGWAYTRQEVIVYLVDETPRTAFAYTVIHKEPGEIRPARAYACTLVAAARERSLPATYVTEFNRWLLDETSS